MRVAIPIWNNRISPVFDVAERVLVLDIDNGIEINRQEEMINAATFQQRSRRLCELEVNSLICEAISKPLEVMLLSSGIQVIPHTCGPLEEVIKTFISRGLTESDFLMPGCCRRRQGRCNRQNQRKKEQHINNGYRFFTAKE